MNFGERFLGGFFLFLGFGEVWEVFKLGRNKILRE